MARSGGVGHRPIPGHFPFACDRASLL